MARNIEDSPGAITTYPKAGVPTTFSYAELNSHTCDGKCESDDWDSADPWII